MDLITTHLHADFDGLAAMVAARKLYPGAALALPGGAQDAVRAFLAVHDLGLTKAKALDLDRITRLVLVDTDDPERIGLFKRLLDRPGVALHVFDHHPAAAAARETARRAELYVAEPVGATTTLMIERLQAHGLTASPFEATVLALGLYEETGSLAYASTTPRDLDAAAWLLRAGADLTTVGTVLQRHLDPEQVALLNDLLQSSETLYLEGCKVLLASSTYDRYTGDLAEVVHRMAELEGLDAVVAAIAMGDKVQIIGRSRVPAIDVGELARAFGGGGHAVAAAATVKGQTVLEVREQLRRWLLERRWPILLAGDVMTKPVKAIPWTVTVAEAERRMTTYGVNVLPLLDSRERFRGLITRESVQKALFHGLAAAPVRQIGRTDVYTASPETPFRDIQAQMIERNQRFVPVLAEGKVVGVITRTDLLRTLHEDIVLAARARAKGEAPPPSSVRRNLRATLRARLPESVYRLLEEAGRLGDESGTPVYAVGGFVRDLLLGIENLDVDLVVEGDGLAYARALGSRVGARVRTHERFGTAVLLFPDGFKLDVATARTEYYEYPTALPTVERSSIKQDLYRRDFTINTLAIRLDGRQFGELIDYYGGQRDLNEGTIRVLHSLSFVEDPTRVFRAIRFEQRLGFRLSKETLALIKGAAAMDLFHRLSGDRLREELLLLCQEQEPRKGLARLGDLGLLRFIHPALTWSARRGNLLKAVEDVMAWYRLAKLTWPSDPRDGREAGADSRLVYLLALLDELTPTAVGDTLHRLAFPERQAAKVRAGHAAAPRLLRELSRRPKARPAEIVRVLKDLPEEALLYLMAKSGSEAVKGQITAFLSTYRNIKPALTGEDLKAMGLKPGPLYRRILDALTAARVNGEVQTPDEERALVRRIWGNGTGGRA
ncbi:CBS domain-containing protein [Nitrospira sp. Kam-Ns4a]